MQATVQPKQSSRSTLLVEKLPLLAFPPRSAVITMYAQQAGGAMRSTAQFSFGVSLENAVVAYAMYLWKMIWPSHLAPLYPHPGDSLAAWQVALSAAGPAGNHWPGAAFPHEGIPAGGLAMVSGNAGSGDRIGPGRRPGYG